MLLEVECLHEVVIPTKDIDTNGMVPARLVVTNLLKKLTAYKALDGDGYILGVTKLKTICKGKRHESTKCFSFLVAFICRTLLPMKGEVMFGIVHRVLRTGVFLKSGPMELVYLSAQKMPNYHLVDEGNPLFLSNDLSRIEEGVVIRFVVLATRWRQMNCDISVLASIEGDSLGPVATAGLDGFEL
ncbi:putative nucleic acid-binding protein [Helianthus annuus]|uniref:DNA-directed RNA polymerase subunit n=2 Tax=Helianthus annuus TaxID=4232 RepID=A0A9K3NX71_HELAN|nr:DNA-directed RNA polymerase IV subunit 7 [Helianthus annuus]XP_022030056.1 DNA-directed RNA polymerase IV subunit 7 [Helianthus annuus]XP_022030057.1 DNA-directed RNA polymerase IV subunit 7 [Helianthus annuus]XP_022030058.1 DNA-directed RNA polymerase IV subunit 7 [Helianthus annuus]KAF5816652.1 putative nucleic acid-binding protein [Helianthus annuus]KAJ0594885.1 putative nucleic acid-binding protein [Helianthus annuus]KAJ0609925.1 putative nucleic acid-binding protein [Helianthus annuus